MTWYPACSGSEEEGSNFEPPVIGIPFQRGLREAKAFDRVAKDAYDFHEARAIKCGIDRPLGMAHLKAARAYKEAAGRLQEMFENGGEVGELPPKVVMKANKAAMLFHKKQAEKAGLDSDLGHAHTAALEHHMDIHRRARQQHRAMKGQQESAEGGQGSGPRKGSGSRDKCPQCKSKLEKDGSDRYCTNCGFQGSTKEPRGTDYGKEAVPGHGSKQRPMPVPHKSQQPSEDVHDPTKPPVQLNPDDANKGLSRLQQKRAARAFGRQGFGPVKASREADGPDMGTRCKLPSTDPLDQQRREKIFRDKLRKFGKTGPQAAKARIHDAASERRPSGTDVYESRRYL